MRRVNNNDNSWWMGDLTSTHTPTPPPPTLFGIHFQLCVVEADTFAAQCFSLSFRLPLFHMFSQLVVLRTSLLQLRFPICNCSVLYTTLHFTYVQFLFQLIWVPLFMYIPTDLCLPHFFTNRSDLRLKSY